MKKYDVIIVGAGPAGIFAALEIVSSGRKLKVLMVEKGVDITDRICPSLAENIPCKSCPYCRLVCGWGGSGAFIYGKLIRYKKTAGER